MPGRVLGRLPSIGRHSLLVALAHLPKSTDVTPLLQIDHGRLLNQLPVWAPDAAIREKILVTNPARLYGFNERV
jgi:hypothetical protein